jgi:hypothetical protein
MQCLEKDLLACSRQMDPNETLSSEILSHVEIIGDIYGIVKKAAIVASEKTGLVPKNKEKPKKTCIIIPNEIGIMRDAKACLETTKFPIIYDPNHLTIVGGAALNIYDYKLSDLKKRRSLGELKEYIKKKTSDIDINWWPVVSRQDMVIIISSEVIAQLATSFYEELQIQFNDHVPMLLERIKPFIPGITLADKLQISVSRRLTFLAGVYNYTITFVIKNKIIKICDINLHDAGSGQQYDKHGQQIREVRPMTDDPTYCNPNPNHVYAIRYLTIGNEYVAVPNIVSLVNQQLFAFENMLRSNKTDKALVNYRRVEFMDKVISSLKLHDPKNQRNFEEIQEVFGTDNTEYVESIIDVIRSSVQVSLTNHLQTIVQLCTVNEKKQDPTMTDLCEHVYQIINSYRLSQSKLYDTLIVSIEKKKKISRSMLFRRGYDELLFAIQNKRDKILHGMTMNEVIQYKEKNGLNDYVHFVKSLENIDKRREFNIEAKSLSMRQSSSYKNNEA